MPSLSGGIFSPYRKLKHSFRKVGAPCRQHRHSRSRARQIQKGDAVFLTENFSPLSVGCVTVVEASNSLSRKRNSRIGCLCNPYGLRKRSCPGCQDNRCWFAPDPFQDKRKTNAGFGANRLECNYNPYGWQKQAVRFALTRFQVWDQYLSVLICDLFGLLKPTFRKVLATLFGML